MRDAHFILTGRLINRSATTEIRGDGTVVYRSAPPAGHFTFRSTLAGQPITFEDIFVNGTDYARTLPSDGKWTVKPDTPGLGPTSFSGASDFTYLGEQDLRLGRAWHVQAKHKGGSPFEGWIRESDGFPLRYTVLATNTRASTTMTLTFDSYNTGVTIAAPRHPTWWAARQGRLANFWPISCQFARSDKLASLWQYNGNMIDHGAFRAPDQMLVMPTLTLEVTRLLEDLARFQGTWARLQRTQPEQLRRLRRIATVESVAASTRIEGADVTNAEVASILDGLALEPMRTRDASEVRGYSDLLNLVYEQSTELPLTENYIRQMHKVLLQHSEIEAHHRGEFKRVPNDVMVSTPDGRRVTMLKTASPFETTVLIPRLVEEYGALARSSEWHPLILIADFALWFLSIHPFLEGNGRLSRALATLMLLQNGYDYVPFASLEKVVEDNKADYYSTLQRSQIAARDNAREYQPWLVFFLKALRAQQQNLIAALDRDGREQALTTDQRKLFDALERAGSASAAQLASQLGRPSRTIRYNLAVLVDRNLVEFEGRRRGRRYRPAETGSSASVRETRVVQAEESVVDRTEASPLQESGPNFARQASPQANSLLYAGLVIGGVPESNAPLTDHDLDVIEGTFRRLEPEATAVRATPDVSWWHAASAQPGTDRWQGWLLPGPVVSIMRAFDGVSREEGQAVSLAALIEWWRSLMTSHQAVMRSLGAVRVELGLWLQTYPSGRPNVVDLTFDELPTPTHGAPPSAVPPWSYRTRAFDIDSVSPAILRPAAVSLLRHFSYRHLDPTLGPLGL